MALQKACRRRTHRTLRSPYGRCHASAATRWQRAVAQMRQPPWRSSPKCPRPLLVLVEILVLFSGVVSRYAFHKPLTWSDELAGMLFLWLAMFGAVIAFRRSAHMRMTALVDIASPGTRAFLDLVGVVAAGAFPAPDRTSCIRVRIRRSHRR